MAAGLDHLKHIVVLMMENRSFDHMLGGLSLVMEKGKKKYPKINGLTGGESNPDRNGTIVTVQPNAKFQGQLNHDPDHHFPGVDLQIFGTANHGPGRVANMQGFIESYATQDTTVDESHAIMYYFSTDHLPVLTRLATEYATFNGWFASISGPTICNRAFAHYGTSFGNVDMNLFYVQDPIVNIYERMIQGGHTAKIYYYDQQSSTMEIVNLLKSQPQVFATYSQFIADCHGDTLPDYCFIEPCYNDHPGPGGGQILASDQHPDHNVQEGERFIANTYNAIRTKQELWETTAMLIVYDEHGGIYDHVVPPNLDPNFPDGNSAPGDKTGTGVAFNFDRLGVRVPAILVSPYVPRGTVIPGTEDPKGIIFEHACIPGTVTSFFLKDYDHGTAREKNSKNFLTPLTDTLRPDDDCWVFDL